MLPAAPSSASFPLSGRTLGKVSVVVFVLALAAGVDGQPLKKSSSWVNGLVHEGVPIACDLPESEQMKNIGSALDGAGMCVFSSIEMSARYQGLEQMRDFRDWAARKYNGGGWPAKVDRLLTDWFATKKIEPIPYLQYEGVNPETVLDVVNRTNRMAAITYGYSPRYGSRIAHMVNCVLFHPKYGVVLDNNFPGDRSMEWMSRDELIRRTRLQPRGGLGPAWVFIWLTPGSPPPPKGRAPNPGEFP